MLSKVLTVSCVKEFYRRTPIILPIKTRKKDFMKVPMVHRSVGADRGLTEILGAAALQAPLLVLSLLILYTALYTAVHTMGKFCLVACHCSGKAVQKLVTDVHLDVELP